MISIESLVVTPSGPIRLKHLKVGDVILDKEGAHCRVDEIEPHAVKDLFEVNFTSYGSVLATACQSLGTRTQSQRTRKSPYTVKSIDLIQNTLRDKRNLKVHEVETITSPVEFNEGRLIVDPYLLGTLLGDGMMKYGRIMFSNPEQEMLDKIASLLPSTLKLDYRDADNIAYWIVGLRKGQPNMLIRDLKELGVYGHGTLTKDVPHAYLLNSYQNRLSLLHGLLDTDGWSGIDKKSGRSRTQFYSISLQLALAVIELVLSFGGVATLRKREYDYDAIPVSGKGHNHPLYVVNITLPFAVKPHTLKRKLEPFNPPPVIKYIDNIIPTGTGLVSGIKTDSPTGTYLVNEYHVIYS